MGLATCKFETVMFKIYKQCQFVGEEGIRYETMQRQIKVLTQVNIKKVEGTAYQNQMVKRAQSSRLAERIFQNVLINAGYFIGLGFLSQR